MSVEDTSSGRIVIMTAAGPDGCTYEWDTGDGRTATTDHGRMAFRAPGNGTYTASVTISEIGLTETFEYKVDDGGSIRAEYILAGAAVLAGLAVAAVRTGRREVADTGKHGNPYDARRGRATRT